jgi:putative ABC transport system permease protein
VVARPRYFPGMRLVRSPTLVVDRTALARVDRLLQWREEVWTTAAGQRAVADALLRAEVGVDRVKDPDRFLSVTELTPLVWSFGYLRALAALTGVIALAALVLHVAARERQRSVSHVLARRMGLRRRTHLLSLAHELGWLVGVGWLAGAALGWAAALLVTRFLDFDPQFPPAAAAAFPLGLLLATAVAAAGFVAVGVAVAQRSADRTRPAEVLRLGG